jgi:hypothetical protein
VSALKFRFKFRFERYSIHSKYYCKLFALQALIWPAQHWQQDAVAQTLTGFTARLNTAVQFDRHQIVNNVATQPTVALMTLGRKEGFKQSW